MVVIPAPGPGDKRSYLVIQLALPASGETSSGCWMSIDPVVGLPNPGDRRRRGSTAFAVAVVSLLAAWRFGLAGMAAGKRYAELHLAERTGAKIRKSLENYTSTYRRSSDGRRPRLSVCHGLWL